MINLRKHIALFLLGIFFFPILFHSAHIVWHQSIKHKCEHDICRKKLSLNDLDKQHEGISEKVESCLICEYKFPISYTTKIFFFHSVIPASACIFNELDKQQQFKQVFSDKTPRAPPVLVS